MAHVVGTNLEDGVESDELLQLKHGPLSLSVSIYLSVSLMLTRSLIVPRLTGRSQPMMEMSYGGVAWCGKLVDE